MSDLTACPASAPTPRPTEWNPIGDWDSLSFLARPGILFTLCLWVHSVLVYMLVLHEASTEDRAALRAGHPHSGDVERSRFRWHKKDLQEVIHQFLQWHGDKLTDDEKIALGTLQNDYVLHPVIYSVHV